jgi:drug/metabolite transporter (DMT)-like permease
VAGVAEDTPRVVVALVAVGVAGAASVVSDRPPTLGGSVASGTGAALSMGGAFVDARPASSLVARGSAVGMVVAAGSGTGMVWLVFLFLFLFFSSFFSSASLERKGEGRLGGR